MRQNGSAPTVFYVHDGHGSVRALTDPTGNVTDTYDYDAFGNVIHSTGSTPNIYLFAGEQYDPDLGLYYNRARYLNTNTGRFWTMDPHDGDPQSPLSLHRYLYAGADPVNRVDPSGRFDFVNVAITAAIVGVVSGLATLQVTGSKKKALLVAGIAFVGVLAGGAILLAVSGTTAAAAGAGAAATTAALATEAQPELEYIGGLIVDGRIEEATAYVITLASTPKGVAVSRFIHIQISIAIAQLGPEEAAGQHELLNLYQQIADLTGKFLQ